MRTFLSPRKLSDYVSTVTTALYHKNLSVSAQVALFKLLFQRHILPEAILSVV